MINLSLNSKNLHNITIILTNLRYTRFIDRKFYTFEDNYDDCYMLLEGLNGLANLSDELFILACSIQGNLRDSSDDL